MLRAIASVVDGVLMHWKTFSIGWVLALAVILFAQRRPTQPRPLEFRKVVDLTHKAAFNVSDGHLETFAYSTRLDEPLQKENGRWSAETITPDRLIAPLVIMDVRDRVASDPSYEVTLADLGRWEAQHGHVPPGAVVIARTGWQMPAELPKAALPHAAFSSDLVEFLVRARLVYGIGIDAPSVDLSTATEMPVRRYLGQNHVYVLANVAHLADAPETGAILVAGPTMIQNAAGAPVRLLAMVR